MPRGLILIIIELYNKYRCENSLPPAVEQDAAARPQPLLLGRTRSSQSNKLKSQETQWQPRGCPTDHTRCRTKETGDSENHSTTAVSQFGSKSCYTTIDEQEQHRTTDQSSSPSSNPSLHRSFIQSHSFQVTVFANHRSDTEVLARRLIGTCAD